ncbi:hypothetical protein Lepil_1117 [Leptonema illini DSM 21528]|uniref:Uncharacterized protein n=1 Tax=Leptonema illini DSM 21528 TaxID=929563 RepID=H2CGX0_9LEPT|nr:hypothetical protein Lepil_1117 [Leptonema illini DSM 21528]
MIDSGLVHCNQFGPPLFPRQMAVRVEKLSQEQD